MKRGEFVTVREYLQVFRKRWRVVVVGLVLGVVAAGAATLLRSPEYLTAVTIFISAQPENALLRSALDSNELAMSRMTTYTELARSTRIAEEVAARLGPDVSTEEIADKIFTIERPDTTLITVAATDASPERAARIANLVAEQLVSDVAVLEQRPDGHVPIVTGQIFEQATPPLHATSPRPLHNFVVGVALGLVVGLGGALVVNAGATLPAPTTPAEQAG